MILIGVFAFLMAMFFVQPAGAVPVALVAAALAVAETSAIAIIATAVINLAISAAISFVAQALLRPAAGHSASAATSADSTVDNKITTQQTTAPLQVVYGNTRVGGIYAFIHTTTAAAAAAASESADWFNAVFGPGTVPPPAATQPNGMLHLVICYAGHQSEAIDEVWFDNHRLVLDDFGNVTGELDADGNTIASAYSGNATVKVHLGAPDQAADAALIAAAPDVWTANHRLGGITYLYVRLIFDATVYSNGVPNITALGRWKNDIYDPRTATTGYSSNSALVLANYLCDPLFGLPVDYAMGIDETALIAAANICDEDIPVVAGGTEKRYSTDGGQTSDAQPQEIIGRLLGAMHGICPYNGEKWRIIAGAYQTPTLDFDDDMLRGGPSLQVLTSRRDLYNSVKGTYVGPDNQWQSASFPEVDSQAFIAADQQQIYKDVELPLTSSAARAQRISKIDLLKSRQQIVATMPCTLSAWRCQAGDTITWTSPRYGWTAKPFEVYDVQFIVDPDTSTIGVDLELHETDPSIYDWTTDEESTVDPAPNTNFPDVFNVLAPSNLSIAESKYTTNTGGGVKSKVTVSWLASLDAFVTSGGHYRAGYRLSGTGPFVTTDTTELTVDFLDLAPGLYDFEAIAINYAGNPSPPLTVTREIAGLSDTPSAPANLQVTAAGMGTLAMLRWDKSPDLDVLQGGSIVFRFCPATTGATWSTGVTIAAPMDGSQVQAVLPLKAGTYLAKFVDSTGNWSDAATAVSAQGAALDFSTLADAVESPDFSGVATGCFADDGVLRIEGAGDFDSVPSVDALVSWDYAGGVIVSPGAGVPSASYAFAAPIDLGSVTSCRLTGLIESQVEDVFDDFDSRSGTVDEWASWDGMVTGQEADAVLMVRTTPDDPADGGAVWSGWNRLDSAEATTRGVQARLDLYSYDQSYDIAVSALAIVAEAPA